MASASRNGEAALESLGSGATSTRTGSPGPSLPADLPAKCPRGGTILGPSSRRRSRPPGQVPTRRGNRGSQFGRNLRSHERRSSRPPTVHSAWDEFALAYRELATDAKAQRADQSRSFARFYEEGPATLEPAFVEFE